MAIRIRRILLGAAVFAACALPCLADTMWDYEAVDSIGYGIHPKVWADETDPDSRITIEGVALAGHDEILNPNFQYTVFLQDDMSDRGGMQAWTGKFFYGDEMWALLRTTDYIDYQAGDRLRISGLIADMGRGKVVINNRGHSGDPNLVWHVDIIGHTGLPDPELIPSVSHCNYFDETRAGGGERYQTRYTMLHGVEISSGVWGSNKLLTLSDATGSVGMLLSAMGDFDSFPQPAGKLNVVGIFDQEDDQVSPYTDGYRIWVKRMSDVAAALDACREVAYRTEGDRVALVNKVVSRVYDGFFYVQDEDRSSGVRVVSSRQFDPGDLVSVQGTVCSAGGAKAICANYVSRSAQSAPPRPVCVGSPVVRAERGLDVDGLLVRVCGRVGAYQGDGIFGISDGGGTVYVAADGANVPAEGSIAAVTGVATRPGGTATLLVAGSSDIQTFGQ